MPQISRRDASMFRPFGVENPTPAWEAARRLTRADRAAY
jgi:hypothetical protein